jgi:excisionase family DNA binding protein
VDKQLTVIEAAERLGLSAHQLYRRIQRGDLNAPTMTVDSRRSYRISEAEIERYLRDGKPLTVPTRSNHFLSTAEVAKMTGYTTETVRRYCKTGIFRFKRGKGSNAHFRILAADVAAYLHGYTIVRENPAGTMSRDTYREDMTFNQLRLSNRGLS